MLRRRFVAPGSQPQGPAILNPKLRAPKLVWSSTASIWSLQLGPDAPSTPEPANLAYKGKDGAALVLTSGLSARFILAYTPFSKVLPPGLDTCTIAMVRRSKSTALSGATTFGADIGASARVLAHAPYSDGNVYWDFGNATAGSGRVSGSFGAKTLDTECLVFVAGQVKGREIWRSKLGGKPTRLAQSNSAKAALPDLSSGNYFSLGAAGATGAVDDEEHYLFVLTWSEWTDSEIADFCANPAAFTFAGGRSHANVADGSGVALVGASATATAASGTLSVSAALGGTSATTTTASATLTARSQLAGSSSTGTQAQGALSVRSNLVGSSTTPTTAQGTLTATSSGAIAGASATPTTAVGTLTVRVALAGASVTPTTGFATLDNGTGFYVPSLETFESPSRARTFNSPSRALPLTSPSRAKAFESPSRALAAFVSPSRASSFSSPSRARAFTSPTRARTFVSPARTF